MTTATNTQDLDAESTEELETEAHEEGDTEEQEDSKPATRAEIAELKALISRQFAQSAPAETAKPKNIQLSPEQIAAFKDRPDLMMEFVQAKVEESTKQVASTLSQDRWDRKAYDEYPALKNDQKFRKLVEQEIRSLVSEGGLSAASPSLLHTAARIAASSYQSKSQNAGTKPNTSALSSLKKKPMNASGAAESQEYEQRTRFLRMAGHSEEKIKKMFERHQKSLVPSEGGRKKVRL